MRPLRGPATPDPSDMPSFETVFSVRSYELDAFGHMNHAVAVRWFEEARWRALAEAGFPPASLPERGEGVWVVHLEVDFRSEARQGDRIRCTTTPEAFGRTSVTLRQDLAHEEDGRAVAEGRVVVVWVGSDGRPKRVPPDVRSALGSEASPDTARGRGG